MPKPVETPVGETFGSWTVLYEGEKGPNGKRRVMARCGCGEDRLVYLASLRAGRTKSCGCRSTEPIKEPAKAKARQPQLVTVQGRTMPLSDWSRETGLPTSTIRHRLKRGWSESDAVLKPVGSR